ncbi:MAG TPA: carboxylesterase family protein, partial [Galbitalea sp.]
ATTPSRIEGLLASTPPDAAAALRRSYRLPSRRGALDFGGDFAFFFPAQDIAELHSRVAPTWLYRLDYAPRALRMLGFGATHGLDLLTVFGRTRTPLGRLMGTLGGGRALHEVSERMQRHWARFATTGTPQSNWTAYDEESRASMVFDDIDHIEFDSRGDRRRAWDGFVHVHEWNEGGVAGRDVADESEG